MNKIDANKGVISLELPDELRPIAIQSNSPIDFVYNPFGMYSRMTYGSLTEGIISKAVWKCDEHIKNNPNECVNTLYWLNENVIKHLNNDDYYSRVKNMCEIMETDKQYEKDFVDHINRHNLFIEGPAFSEIDIKQLLKQIRPSVLEPVLLKKELIDYMKDKLNIMKDLTITSDITLKNIFISKVYMQKLYKLAEKNLSTRDLGGVKSITGQPLKGKSVGGGSRIGQMEIESILSNGCEKSLVELLSVKSDRNDEKRRLISDLVQYGSYKMPNSISTGKGKTRIVVNTLLSFLKQ